MSESEDLSKMQLRRLQNKVGLISYTALLSICCIDISILLSF